MMIDLTNELAPVLVGLNVALVVSAAALVDGSVRRWFASIGHIQTPRFTVHRPALAR